MRSVLFCLTFAVSTAFAQQQATPTSLYLNTLSQLAAQVAQQGIGGNYEAAKVLMNKELQAWTRTDYKCCENETFVFEVIHKGYDTNNQMNLLVLQATPNFGGSVQSSTYSKGDERIILREHLTMRIEFAIKLDTASGRFGGMGNFFTDTEVSLKYQAPDKSLLPFESLFRKKLERAVQERELHQMTLEFSKDPHQMYDDEAIAFAKASLGL